MQRLLLIRHAKAAAYGREPGDHARPLSDKGHRHANILGTMLANAGWAPDMTVVSNALRTRQTWEDISQAFDERSVRFEESLYLASPKVLAQMVGQHAQTNKTLALIGHNPGIAFMAHQLLEEGFDHDGKAAAFISANFKTGWAAVFEIRNEGPRLAHLFDPRTA